MNLAGAFRCAKYAGEAMKAGDGRLSGLQGGLEAFENQLASEWAADGVRVNNICPGYVIDGGYTVR